MTEVQHTASHLDHPVDRIYHYYLLTLTCIDLCVHAYVIFLISTIAKDTLKTFRYCLLFCGVSTESWLRCAEHFGICKHFLMNLRFAKSLSLLG